jgi:hypothetical protein
LLAAGASLSVDFEEDADDDCSDDELEADGEGAGVDDITAAEEMAEDSASDETEEPFWLNRENSAHPSSDIIRIAVIITTATLFFILLPFTI